MKESSITLFLELEKAKKEYKKSLTTLVSIILCSILFITIAAPAMTRAAFVGSNVLVGPVINGKPTIELKAYGIEFNEELLSSNPDAKQWETEPNPDNAITVYIQPDYSYKKIVTGEDEEFKSTGEIKYNLYFINGDKRSEVYSNEDVYVYFSPGSTYTKYNNLKKEITSSSGSLIRTDEEFYDYYLSGMLFLELYLKEALPQNNAHVWKDINNNMVKEHPYYELLNNQLSYPEKDYLETLKGRETIFHVTNSDKGVYTPSYSPIQYHTMPEWESVYRINESAYIPKTYFSTDLTQDKNMTDVKLNDFYANLMNIPGLYQETFELFYDIDTRLQEESKYISLQRLNVTDNLFGENLRDGYVSATETIKGYDYFTLFTFTNNFYKTNNSTSPLNIEYDVLYGGSTLNNLDMSVDKITTISLKDYEQNLIPMSMDNIYDDNLEKFSVYTLEKEYARATTIKRPVDTSTISTAIVEEEYKSVETEKIKSNVVSIMVPREADDRTVYIVISEEELQEKITDGTVKMNLSDSEQNDNFKHFLNQVCDSPWDKYQVYAWDDKSTTAFNNLVANDDYYKIIKDGIKGPLIEGDLQNEDDMSNSDARLLVFLAGWGQESPTWLYEAIANGTTGTWFWEGAEVSIKHDVPTELIPPPSASLATWAKEHNLEYVVKNYSDKDLTSILNCVVDDEGIDVPLMKNEGALGTVSPGGDTKAADFFGKMVQSLIDAFSKILDLIIGNAFYALAKINLWAGFTIFSLTATGTSQATQAHGPFGYIESVMSGPQETGSTSIKMIDGYSMLQNISILIVLIIVVWYGFGAVMGDMMTGIIGQTNLKEMFPRLVIAIFMIGTTTNGHIFSGSIIIADLVLYIVDSFTQGILAASGGDGSVLDISTMFGLGNLVTEDSPNFIAAMMLFIITLGMLFLFVAGAFLFIARIIVIWVLILMAPICWAFYVHNSTASIATQWLKTFVKTTAVQFFWILLIIVFAIVFSMPKSTILGIDPTADSAKGNGSGSTTETETGTEGETSDAGTGNDYSSIIDKDGLDSLVRTINYEYKESGYEKQKEIYQIVFESNIDSYNRIVSIAEAEEIGETGTEVIEGPAKAFDSGIDLSGTSIPDSGLTQIINVFLTGLMAGMFFFMLLKSTSSLVSGAVISGVGTVQSVGNNLKNQLQRPAKAPVRALNNKINKTGDGLATAVTNPRKTAIKGAAQLGKARDLKNTAKQHGIGAAAAQAIAPTKKKVDDFKKELREAYGPKNEKVGKRIQKETAKKLREENQRRETLGLKPLNPLSKDARKIKQEVIQSEKNKHRDLALKDIAKEHSVDDYDGLVEKANRLASETSVLKQRVDSAPKDSEEKAKASTQYELKLDQFKAVQEKVEKIDEQYDKTFGVKAIKNYQQEVKSGKRAIDYTMEAVADIHHAETQFVVQDQRIAAQAKVTGERILSAGDNVPVITPEKIREMPTEFEKVQRDYHERRAELKQIEQHLSNPDISSEDKKIYVGEQERLTADIQSSKEKVTQMTDTMEAIFAPQSRHDGLYTAAQKELTQAQRTGNIEQEYIAQEVLDGLKRQEETIKEKMLSPDIPAITNLDDISELSDTQVKALSDLHDSISSAALEPIKENSTIMIEDIEEKSNDWWLAGQEYTPLGEEKKSLTSDYKTAKELTIDSLSKEQFAKKKEYIEKIQGYSDNQKYEIPAHEATIYGYTPEHGSQTIKVSGKEIRKRLAEDWAALNDNVEKLKENL